MRYRACPVALSPGSHDQWFQTFRNQCVCSIPPRSSGAGRDPYTCMRVEGRRRRRREGGGGEERGERRERGVIEGEEERRKQRQREKGGEERGDKERRNGRFPILFSL